MAPARDEHRQAIEWLNQHTDSNIGFFLVEIELWQINDSLLAPKFNVVEKPNDWAKTMKSIEGLKLIVDGKHITGGVTGKTVGTVLVAHTDGTLKTGSAEGVYFKVTKTGVKLTEAAVEVKVCVA